jgi:hypothetical protein
MEKSNVNNLNGIPNFGLGFPEEHVKGTSESEVSDGGVQEASAPLGVEEGTEGEVKEASVSDSVEASGSEQSMN